MPCIRKLRRLWQCATMALLLGVPVSHSARAQPPPTAAELGWDKELDEQLARHRKDVALAVVGKDDNVVFEPSKDDRAPWVQRVRFHRQVVWKQELPAETPGQASLTVDKDAVYIVHYSAISSGATVRALDLATGRKLWSTPVKGLGPQDHSKYYNHVLLRMVRGYLVAFGNEAHGRYIEVFDPRTGKMLSTRMLPAN